MDRTISSTDDVPEKLYHYTNSEGLIGIIKDRALWATNLHFLNDAEEFNFATHFAVGDLIRRVAHGEHERLVKRLREITDPGARGVDSAVYVVLHVRRARRPQPVASLLPTWRVLDRL